MESLQLCGPAISSKGLSESFFAQRAIRILDHAHSISKEELEVMGRLLQRINTIFEVNKAMRDLKFTMRGAESLSQYRSALDILESKFRAQTNQHIIDNMAAIHGEVKGVIRSRSADPQKTKNAVKFLEGLQDHATQTEGTYFSTF